MSDNIPFEIQSEIIKSLIQFLSVSKQWKSFISSSDFIKHYSSQQQHLLVKYYNTHEEKYVSIADNDTFPQNKVSLTVPPLVSMLISPPIIGCSHGLLCLSRRASDDHIPETGMAVVWNPSIRKAVDVVVPNLGSKKIYETVLGFGVCRETVDPKIIKITQIFRESDLGRISCIPWQVEVFALSTGTWRRPYSGNLPRKSIRVFFKQVVVDGFLYWLAVDRISMDGGFTCRNLIVSFNLTSEEFGEVNLPDSITQHDIWYLSIFKLRESLVVFDRDTTDAWMMEVVTKSFSKLFADCVMMPNTSVRGFGRSGKLIVDEFGNGNPPFKLVAYEPYSKPIGDVGVDRSHFPFCVHPYVETLLLLDQPNPTAYDEMETL